MGRSNRTTVAVVIGVVAVLAGAGLAKLGESPVVTSHPDLANTEVEAIDVHVAGWVNIPGVVSVPDGSIVADVIGAAGGLRAGANTDAVNLAARVLDGDQVLIPGPDADRSEEGDGRISLNRATSAELEELPGVGPVLAARIVAYREGGGRFESVEDLLEVPGIGEAKLAAIRDLVRP